MPIACSTLPRAGTEYFARWAGCETRGSWAEQSEETGMTSWGTDVRARPALPFFRGSQGIFRHHRFWLQRILRGNPSALPRLTHCSPSAVIGHVRMSHSILPQPAGSDLSMTDESPTITALEAQGYTQIECHCGGCGFWAESFNTVRERHLHPTIGNLNVAQLMMLLRCAFCPGRPLASAARPWGQCDADHHDQQLQDRRAS